MPNKTPTLKLVSRNSEAVQAARAEPARMRNFASLERELFGRSALPLKLRADAFVGSMLQDLWDVA